MTLASLCCLGTPTEHAQMCAPVQDMDTGAGEAGPVQLPSGEQVVTQHVALPPRVLQLLKEHTAFLHGQGQHTCPHFHKHAFPNKTHMAEHCECS